MRPEVLRADWTLKGVLLGSIFVALLTAFTVPEPEPTVAEPRIPPAAEPIELFGVASWYGEWFRGRTTSCGEPYDPDALTAAHRSLPCGTRLRVEHGDRRVVVEVNDRGPYVAGRHIDLSRAAFARLAPLGRGLLDVRATLLPSP